jgi:hypothetical protein
MATPTQVPLFGGAKCLSLPAMASNGYTGGGAGGGAVHHSFASASAFLPALPCVNVLVDERSPAAAPARASVRHTAASSALRRRWPRLRPNGSIGWYAVARRSFYSCGQA